MDMKKIGLVLCKCLLSIIILSSANCNDETPIPPADPRDKLTGIFQMTKLENGQTYTMMVEKVGDLCNNFCDSLKYTNYGDLLNFTYVRTPTTVDSILYVGIVSPITDKYDRRWKFSNHGNSNPPYNHNLIYNDSIKITFKLSNLLYYQADSVPLVVDTILTHVGIKIADVE